MGTLGKDPNLTENTFPDKIQVFTDKMIFFSEDSFFWSQYVLFFVM